jgi:hypothetical protein
MIVRLPGRVALCSVVVDAWCPRTTAPRPGAWPQEVFAADPRRGGPRETGEQIGAVQTRKIPVREIGDITGQCCPAILTTVREA